VKTADAVPHPHPLLEGEGTNNLPQKGVEGDGTEPDAFDQG
jgi:hypothetical protein